MYFIFRSALMAGAIFGTLSNSFSSNVIGLPTSEHGKTLSDTTTIAGTDTLLTQKPIDSTKITELNKVIVSASKYQRLIQTPQSLSVISPESWLGTGKSIADIIGEQTGVQTQRFGGIGSYQTVSIRGVKGSEVLVLFDGIPLNSAMGGAVDLGKINPLQLGEIEVYKGVTPVKFGGNSIGGVINLKSKNNAHNNNLSIYSSIGSYGFQNHSISFSKNSDTLHQYSGSFTYLHSNNDFKYVDRNNTYNGTLKDPTLDDKVKKLVNSEFTGIELRVFPSFRISKEKRLASSISTSSINQRIPAPESKVNHTAYSDEKSLDLHMQIDNDESVKRLLIMPHLAYHFSRSLLFSTSLDSGFQTAHGNVSNISEYYFTNNKICLTLNSTLPVNENLTIEPTVIAQCEDANPRSKNDDITYGDWHSREASLSLSTDVLYSLSIFLFKCGGTVNGMYDQTKGGYENTAHRIIPASDTTVFIWSLSGSISCKPIDNFTFFLNAARYSNSPSLQERFGARGGHVPNAALKAETGNSIELGSKLTFKNNYSEIAAFYNRSKNTILLSRDGFQSRSINADGASVKGIEITNVTSIKKILTLNEQVTLQNALNLDAMYKNKRLPDEPDLKVSAGFDFCPLKQISLQYTASFKSFYYHTPSNNIESRVPEKQTSPGKLYHYVKLNYTPVKKLTLSASGSNLNSSMIPGQNIQPKEGPYSWMLYPENEWCVSVNLTF